MIGCVDGSSNNRLMQQEQQHMLCSHVCSKQQWCCLDTQPHARNKCVRYINVLMLLLIH